MSSNNSTFTSSYSFSSNVTSSTNNGEQTTGHRTMHQTTSDPTNGTTVHTSTQNLGEPSVQETRHYDPQGRELLEGGGGSGAAGRRIEDVSDSSKQAQRDAEYEERMEEEYAKREGGA